MEKKNMKQAIKNFCEERGIQRGRIGEFDTGLKLDHVGSKYVWVISNWIGASGLQNWMTIEEFWAKYLEDRYNQYCNIKLENPEYKSPIFD